MLNRVEQELSNGILILRLNRPDKLNALNQELLDTLHALLQEAKTSSAIKAVLLTGNGKAFCAGADIARLKDCNSQSGYDFSIQGQSLLRELETLGKPSLAAINGFAFGGGLELAMAATIRIAASTALCGLPEVKLGVIPGYGGTQRLARLIGKGRALYLCLSGCTIDASTALDYGLVTEVVAPEALLNQGKKILSTLLTHAPLALEAVMEVIDKGYDLPLEDALDEEALAFAKICDSQDKNEGVSAFLEKRPAVFSGV